MARAGLAIFLLILATLAGAGTRLGPAIPTEQERLQGTWQIVSVSRSGQSEDWQVGGLVTFAENTVAFAPGLTAMTQDRQEAITRAAFS